MQMFIKTREIRRLAASAIFFSSFGAIWLALAFHAWKILSVTAGLSIALGAALLLSIAVTLLRNSKRGAAEAANPAKARARNWINVILGVAITGLYFAMSRMHLDPYFPSALTALVGLHKFALARAFQFVPYRVVGAVLLAWAIGSAAFIPPEQLPGWACLGTGVMLWLSAAVTLSLAWSAIRQSTYTRQARLIS